MRNQGYNGKTHLLVTYQWNNAQCDAIVIDQDFDTTNEAYRQMLLVMPAQPLPDDGHPIKEWEDLIEKGCEDIFNQYNCQLDTMTNILAVLRPVID